MRTFESKVATRERVPLLLGLVGPSGGGKTFSALRLATGIREVVGSGEIHVIDTEARRALHYADRFSFKHLAFGAPFGSLDYLAAVEHCVAEGASVVVIDSGSHEHDGPGGLLEAHDAETERLAKAWGVKPSVAQLSAWQKPKAERRRLINRILQLPINLIVCFRAKEKLKIRKGEDPLPLGWMPIAGEEWIYEMTLNALLLPGAGGRPTWQSEELGERQMIKLPGWARELVPHDKPLDEATGAALARWAEGTVVRSPKELIEAYALVQDSATLGGLERERAAMWRAMPKDETKTALKAASEAAIERVKKLEAAPAVPASDGSDLSPEEKERITKALDEENARIRAAKEAEGA
jgi:ABC-type dipeptide/oligopeptide/nickel transport system ATPase subunit